MEEVIDANAPKASECEQEAVKDKRNCLQISVTEKIIFCIDAMVLISALEEEDLFNELYDMLVLYIEMKRKISVESVEFQCMLFYDNKKYFEIVINDVKHLRQVFMNLKQKDVERETGAFDFNVVFSSLAKIVHLPHPAVCSKSLPPPHVYHCVMLFGHNCNVPVMKQTNAFDFLIQSPFFTFDMVYIYNNLIEGNICDVIGHALYSLYDVVNGYFFPVSYVNVDKQYKVFAQLLGHPLIRQPQDRARFNLKELIAQENSK
ncbi:UNVERIFIED_CONTAM: hypothetical protein PYX00_002891 [Menopon gallinae]|uniref:Uncharacterized protein n=1 Tax=Menopon gallinae TaxID=328185 RepID=A0AAW2HZB4_9NEOP